MGSILECLLYWFASSIEIGGTFVIPEVSRDLYGDMEIPSTVFDAAPCRREGEEHMACALACIP